MFLILRVLEAAACLAGFINYRKFRGTYLSMFVFYLLFIVAAEGIGEYLINHDLDHANKIFYNYLVIPGEFLFFFWLFYQTFKASKLQWIPVACTAIYIVAWLVDALHFSKLQFFFYSISYSIGNLLLLVLILRFFGTMITSNLILSFSRQLMFWICLGLLIFYLGSFPFYGLRNTLAYNYLSLYISYCYIVYALNYLMYLTFIIGYIWADPNTKSF